MPTALPEMPSAPECPMCGYSRAGITSATCPECGYVLTEEDRANVYRWQMFLTFTRWSVWRRWLALGAVVGWLLAMRNDGLMGPRLVGVVACLSVGAGIAGSRFLLARGLRGAALRRCWMLAAVYGQVFWLVAAAAYVVPRWFQGFSFVSWSSTYAGEDLLLMLAASGYVGLAMAVLSFRWTCRNAGLTLNAAEKASINEGLKLAVAPWVLANVAAAVVWGLWLLDYLRPRWWMD